VRIDVWKVRLDLKRPFKHARAERRSTENIIARVEHGGAVGWGEGVPRSYVTGESARDAFAFARDLAEQTCRAAAAADLSNVNRVIAFAREHVCPPPDDASHNAASSAVEIALLDAALRGLGAPLWKVAERLLPADLISAPSSVRYSIVISSEKLGSMRRKALLYRLYGFRSVKLKIAAGGPDVERIAAARRALGDAIDLRLDANGGWTLDEALRVLRASAPCGISAVEEPLAIGDEDGLRRLRKELDVKIMLDESFTKLGDVDRIGDHAFADILNVRISKCGGFVRTLECIARAKERDLACQLGCMVGESAILSAAGRQLAQVVPSLCFLEGSYDRHLLKENVARQDLTFGYGGQAPPLDGPGLGVDVDESAVISLASNEEGQDT